MQLDSLHCKYPGCVWRWETHGFVHRESERARRRAREKASERARERQTEISWLQFIQLLFPLQINGLSRRVYNLEQITTFLPRTPCTPDYYVVSDTGSQDHSCFLIRYQHMYFMAVMIRTSYRRLCEVRNRERHNCHAGFCLAPAWEIVGRRRFRAKREELTWY